MFLALTVLSSSLTFFFHGRICFSCSIGHDLHTNVRSCQPFLSLNSRFTMSNVLTIMMLTYPYPTLKFFLAFSLSLNYLLF